MLGESGLELGRGVMLSSALLALGFLAGVTGWRFRPWPRPAGTPPDQHLPGSKTPALLGLSTVLVAGPGPRPNHNNREDIAWMIF